MNVLSALGVLVIGGLLLYIGVTGTVGNVPTAVRAFRQVAGI